MLLRVRRAGHAVISSYQTQADREVVMSVVLSVSTCSIYRSAPLYPSIFSDNVVISYTAESPLSVPLVYLICTYILIQISG